MENRQELCSMETTGMPSDDETGFLAYPDDCGGPASGVEFLHFAQIYRSTVGVVFKGTPHRDSSKETYGDVIAKIAKLSLRQPNKQLLQTLRPDSHILEKQRNDFTTISNNMTIVCVHEELHTALGMIVPPASASYEGFNVSLGAIHANHTDIVKFSERVGGYEKTVGYIRGILDAKLPELEQDSRVCLFLDGLDEYRMTGRENEYTEEQLALVYDGIHTHTAKAIAKYCKDRLTKEAPDLEDLPKFLFEIVKKSSSKEIEKPPPRLGGSDGRYMHMMRNIDPKYLPESKRLFQLVIGWRHHDTFPHLDIMTLFLAEQGHLQDSSTKELRVSRDDYELKSWNQWKDERKRLQRRLKSRCGLLLEGAEGVQFMHQTAKQFISQKYLGPEIFRNAAGFTTEGEVALALLSGMTRRLKRFSEAVVTNDNFSANTVAKDTSPIASILALREEKSNSRVDERRYAVRLLDELNYVKDRLTHHLTDFKDAGDFVWSEAYFLCEPKARTFLDFAILCRLTWYMKAKLEGRELP
ncbi:hypothetical protein F5Y09DRAFT_351359 [Xylaria sp. FL1042]|nr:hypothetical protein F5Y09DRAFT_351359 [Xylaria sp. FL1042]